MAPCHSLHVYTVNQTISSSLYQSRTQSSGGMIYRQAEVMSSDKGPRSTKLHHLPRRNGSRVGNSTDRSDSKLIQVSRHQGSQLLLGNGLGIWPWYLCTHNLLPREFEAASELSGTFRHVSIYAIGIYFLLAFTAEGLWANTPGILNLWICFMASLLVEPSAAPKISENLAKWAVVCQEMNQASKNNR